MICNISSYNIFWCLTSKGKDKGAGYSLHSVILLCRLHIYPDHWACSFMIISQLPREHTAGLLIGAQIWSTDNAITALTVPCFTSLVWRGSGNGLSQGPHYDRFSHDSNPWSSDHWYGALTNYATVAIMPLFHNKESSSWSCDSKWMHPCWSEETN